MGDNENIEPIENNEDENEPGVRVGWIEDINQNIQTNFQDLKQTITDALANQNNPNLSEQLAQMLEPINKQLEALTKNPPNQSNGGGGDREKTPPLPQPKANPLPFLFKKK